MASRRGRAADKRKGRDRDRHWGDRRMRRQRRLRLGGRSAAIPILPAQPFGALDTGAPNESGVKKADQ